MNHLILISVQAESLLKFLEIVIWPITVLTIILLFRRQFRNAMERLGSFKADASGISMSFEPKLDAAKKIFAALKSDGVSKSAVSIQQKKKFTGTPLEKLQQIKAELHNSLSELAQEAHMDPSGRSTTALNRELAERGVIKDKSSHLIAALMDVIDAAPPSVNQSQLNEIEQMYNSI